MAVELTSKT